METRVPSNRNFYQCWISGMTSRRVAALRRCREGKARALPGVVYANTCEGPAVDALQLSNM